jgi:hypothetical protein
VISIEEFRKLALSFPGSSEQPHFEKAAFRAGKKIFASLDSANKLACVKLSITDQDVFSAFDKTIIWPIPNKWGLQGWTNISLTKIRKSMIKDALQCAFMEVATKKLIDEYNGQ